MLVLNGTNYLEEELVEIAGDSDSLSEFLRQFALIADRKVAAEALAIFSNSISVVDELEALRLFQIAFFWEPSSEKVRTIVCRYLGLSDDPVEDFATHFSLQNQIDEYLNLLDTTLDGHVKLVTLAHLLIFSKRIVTPKPAIRWVKERLSMFPSNTRALAIYKELIGPLE